MMMLRRLTAALLTALLAIAAPSQADSTEDVTFAKGVKLLVRPGDDPAWHQASLRFTDSTVILTDAGLGRMLAYWERPAKTATPLTIAYADLLSARYEERLARSYDEDLTRSLLIRYRLGSDGQALKLELDGTIADRVVAMLEARSGLRVTEQLGPAR